MMLTTFVCFVYLTLNTYKSTKIKMCCIRVKEAYNILLKSTNCINK